MQFANRKTGIHGRAIALSISLFLLVIVLGLHVTKYHGNITRKEIIKENEASTAILAVYLKTELMKIGGAAKALSNSPWIPPALITRSKLDIEHANSVLTRYNTAMGASVCYLMDKNGLTVASSNRDTPDSFVGESYWFRPYFMEAIKGNDFSYFATGITSLTRGFYTSSPVRDNSNNIVGVVAIKKEIDEMEGYMRKYRNCFLIDPHGIIFLSSRAEFVSNSLWPVEKETEKNLLLSRQFGEKPFTPLMSKEVHDGQEIEFDGMNLLVARKPITRDGWSIVLLSDTGKIVIYRLIGIIVTIFACFLITVPLMIIYKTAKSAEIAKNSKELFQRLSDQAPFGMVLINKNGKYIYLNSKFTEILGYELDDIPDGKTWLQKAYPDQQKRLEAIRAWKEDFSTFKPGEKSPRIFQPVCKDGTDKIVNIVSTQLETGEYLVTYEDITVRKRLEEQLQTVSLTDELTGLYNRRGFFTLAGQQMKAAERTKKNMMLFFADLDKMKHINDTLGHQEGDNALLDVASILKGAFRDSDIIGRMGGDEFAILAIDTADETEEILTKRLHAFLDAYNKPDRKYQLSLSVGIAHYDPVHPSSIDDLMARADTLMYEDKRKKQN